MIILEQKSSDGYRLRIGHTEIDATRPWLLFIMPFGLRLEMAKPFFDYFESDFNVVTWEARLILDESHSGEISDNLSVECHVNDLFEAIAVFNIEQALVVGYCSGAGVALVALKRKPNLAKCLVLAHGEYTLLKHPGCTTQFAFDIDSILSMAASNDKFAQKVFEKVNSDRLDVEEDVPPGIDMPYSKLDFFKRFAINYTYYKSLDYKEFACEVAQPTLMITGLRDKQTNVKSTELIAGEIPHARVIVDPDGDHYGLLRPSSKTMEIAEDFLRGSCE